MKWIIEFVASIITLAIVFYMCFGGAYARAEEYIATAYCPCVQCCGKSDGITASGKIAKPSHTIACNSLRLGQKVLINDKLYVVEDRGSQKHFGAIGGDTKRLDIYFDTHYEALAWGKRIVNVEVVK